MAAAGIGRASRGLRWCVTWQSSWRRISSLRGGSNLDSVDRDPQTSATETHPRFTPIPLVLQLPSAYISVSDQWLSENELHPLTQQQQQGQGRGIEEEGEEEVELWRLPPWFLPPPLLPPPPPPPTPFLRRQREKENP